MVTDLGSYSLDELQRGRTRVSAECWTETYNVPLYYRLQRGRTRVSAEWSSGAEADHASLLSASTGPHSCECGMWRVCNHGVPTIGKLQRGRTRVSAEWRHCFFHPSRHTPASTGPHSCECGMTHRLRRLVPLCDASTGPHSCECGMVGFVVWQIQSHSCFNGAALV